MSNPGVLGEISYEAESGFAEDVDTFATYRLNTTAAIDLSNITQQHLPIEFVQQFQQGGSPEATGVQGGTFVTRFPLAGHGSTTAGAVTIEEIETLIGIVLGNAVVAAASGTTLTGGTTTIPTTTASGTFSAGALCRLGALGDGDGEGQFYAISTHSTTNLTVLNQLAGAPANGAVMYAPTMMYLFEAPTSAAFTSIRMRVQTGNLKYQLHGCYPTAFTISQLAPGQAPFCEITWGVARWKLTTGGTFPSTTTSDQFLPAPNAAGTMFLNTVGTSTRSTRSYRDLQINFTLGHVPLMGPGGVGANQHIVGCRRQPCMIMVTWTEDADTATTTPTLNTIYENTTGQHMCLTMNTVDGKAVGFYFPRLFPTGPRPVQINDGGVNRLRITMRAATGPTNTNDLTSSAFRMAFA